VYKVDAEKPVATDSPDHLNVWGTARDNSTNHRFNDKAFLLFGRRRLRVMDLGCSGGGFVRSMLDDGHDAIGIEGSDYSARTRRAEWRAIPERLFTADVSEPFVVAKEHEQAEFDLITAWELLEHLREESFKVFCSNVLRHLSRNGLFIASVCTSPDAQWHQTVRPRTWWLEMFDRFGLENHPEIVQWFGSQFVRGRRFGAPCSFHVALAHKGADIPRPPKTPLHERLFDLWHFSLPHRLLREAIVGRK